MCDNCSQYVTVGVCSTQIQQAVQHLIKIKQEYSWHPHAVDAKANNRLYLPRNFGTFHYNDRLVLTMKDQPNRSIWELPGFFADTDISISWQGQNRPIRNGHSSWLASSGRGQEFVITAATSEMERNLKDWKDSIIGVGMNTNLKKEMVNHFVIPDKRGRYYCRMENAVIPVNYDKCRDCPLVAGTVQGEGVECYYEDAVGPEYCLRAPSHYEEWGRISGLIQKGVIKKAPIRK